MRNKEIFNSTALSDHPRQTPSFKHARHMRHSRGRVLKQPIIRVEHLLGNEEEPFSGHASVVQALLSLELHPQPGFQEVGPLDRQDAPVRVLQDGVASQLHFEAVGDVGLEERLCEDSFARKRVNVLRTALTLCILTDV